MTTETKTVEHRTGSAAWWRDSAKRWQAYVDFYNESIENIAAKLVKGDIRRSTNSPTQEVKRLAMLLADYQRSANGAAKKARSSVKNAKTAFGCTCQACFSDAK